MASNWKNKARQRQRLRGKPSELGTFSPATARQRADLLYVQRLGPCAKSPLQRANALQFLYVSEKGSRGQERLAQRVNFLSCHSHCHSRDPKKKCIMLSQGDGRIEDGRYQRQLQKLCVGQRYCGQRVLVPCGRIKKT